MKTNTLRHFLVAGFLGGVIGLSSILLKADEYELGLEAFNKAQYDEAFKLFKIGSQSSDSNSRFLLSTMYRRGLGNKADEYEGFYWCIRLPMRATWKLSFSLGSCAWRVKG